MSETMFTICGFFQYGERLHRSTAITAETFNKIISDLAIGSNSVIVTTD
jgi:hypothetical protein